MPLLPREPLFFHDRASKRVMAKAKVCSPMSISSKIVSQNPLYCFKEVAEKGCFVE